MLASNPQDRTYLQRRDGMANYCTLLEFRRLSDRLRRPVSYVGLLQVSLLAMTTFLDIQLSDVVDHNNEYDQSTVSGVVRNSPKRLGGR